MRRLACALALLAVSVTPAAADDPEPIGCDPAAPASPLQQNPLGPMCDVSDDWRRYQPAGPKSPGDPAEWLDGFCVPADAEDAYTRMQPFLSRLDPDSFPPTRGCATGDPGFPVADYPVPGSTWGDGPNEPTLLVRIKAPILCAGCRRMFLDFSKIPATNDPPFFYAHGHAYYHLGGFNPFYTADPKAHSPNTKNFTNDKLVAPDGSIPEHIAHGFDTHAISNVTSTRKFSHSAIQGPWYIGPWYVSRTGRRINGLYVDVNVCNVPGCDELPHPALNEIRYQSGFNSGERTCLDNFSPQFADGNAFYGGCVDHNGDSSYGVNPFP